MRTRLEPRYVLIEAGRLDGDHRTLGSGSDRHHGRLLDPPRDAHGVVECDADDQGGRFDPRSVARAHDRRQRLQAVRGESCAVPPHHLLARGERHLVTGGRERDHDAVWYPRDRTG